MVNIQCAVLEHRLPANNHIKSCFQIESERYVILVDRGENHSERYVVAVYRCGDTEWETGRYFHELYNAADMFLKRCQYYITDLI